MSWSLFVAVFVLSALAGVAALLRSGKSLTPLAIASSVMNSGTLGLALSLLWYTRYIDNLYFLVGVCILSGLGGTPMVDFFVGLLRFTFRFGAENEKHNQ